MLYCTEGGNFESAFFNIQYDTYIDAYMVIQLFTNISFVPVVFLYLAYTLINRLPLVETFLIYMGINGSGVRFYAYHMCEEGFFADFAFLLDRSHGVAC